MPFIFNSLLPPLLKRIGEWVGSLAYVCLDFSKATIDGVRYIVSDEGLNLCGYSSSRDSAATVVDYRGHVVTVPENIARCQGARVVVNFLGGSTPSTSTVTHEPTNATLVGNTITTETSGTHSYYKFVTTRANKHKYWARCKFRNEVGSYACFRLSQSGRSGNYTLLELNGLTEGQEMDVALKVDIDDGTTDHRFIVYPSSENTSQVSAGDSVTILAFQMEMDYDQPAPSEIVEKVKFFSYENGNTVSPPLSPGTGYSVIEGRGPDITTKDIRVLEEVRGTNEVWWSEKLDEWATDNNRDASVKVPDGGYGCYYINLSEAQSIDGQVGTALSTDTLYTTLWVKPYDANIDRIWLRTVVSGVTTDTALEINTNDWSVGTLFPDRYSNVAISPAPDGWYKIQYRTDDPGASGDIYCAIRPLQPGTGFNTGRLYVWGLQIEKNVAVPTSYIPTGTTRYQTGSQNEGQGVREADVLTASIETIPLEGTFSRNSKATVVDYEGNTQEVFNDAPRFKNSRVVTNYIGDNQFLPMGGDVVGWKGGWYGADSFVRSTGWDDPLGGNTGIRLDVKQTTTADRQSGLIYKWLPEDHNEYYGDYAFVQSIWLRSISGDLPLCFSHGAHGDNACVKPILVTPTWQRFASPRIPTISSGRCFALLHQQSDTPFSVVAWHPQAELVLDPQATNQNPSEHLYSIGTTPVSKCFSTKNPNTVDENGIVTEGNSVNLSNANDIALVVEPSRTNYIPDSQNLISVDFNGINGPSWQHVTVNCQFERIYHGLRFYEVLVTAQDGSVGKQIYNPTAPVPNANAFISSCYVMKPELPEDWRYIRIAGYGLGADGVSFDLLTGTYNINSSWNYAGMEDLGDMYRLWAQSNFSDDWVFAYGPSYAFAGGMTGGFGEMPVGSRIRIAAPQVEAVTTNPNAPGSYIPTVRAQATRLEDHVDIPGVNINREISFLIEQTSVWPADKYEIAHVRLIGGVANDPTVRTLGTTDGTYAAAANGLISISMDDIVTQERNRLVVSRSTSNTIMAVNGVEKFNEAAVMDVPHTIDDLYTIGRWFLSIKDPYNGLFHRVMLFDKALTQEETIALSSEEYRCPGDK